MNYKLEANNGRMNLYSQKIGMNVMEDATVDQVKIALAIEMEYKTKLEIIKLLMTFPHGFLTTNDEEIVNQGVVDEYEAWYKKISQRIGFIDEYYSLIDDKIREIFI